MSVADVSPLRDGLKAALDEISGPTGLQVSKYQLAIPMAPTIHFFPEKVVYRPLESWQWCVQAFLALTPFEQAAQMTLDAMLASSGEASLKAALEADPTLGGVVSDLEVTETEGYQFFETRGSVLLGSSWTLTLLPIG